MKKFVLHASSFKTFWAHYYVNKDQDFIDKLAELGYQLYQSDQIDITEADIILFSEASSIGLHRFSLYHKFRYLAKLLLGRVTLKDWDLYAECVKTGLIKKAALCVAEGIVHMPENHLPELGRMFPVVFTWNDIMIDNVHFFKYCIPQPVRWPEFEQVSFDKKKLLVNISANKYDSHHGERYSIRRTSIRYFEDKFKDQFELYGIGWNKAATKVQNLKKNFPYYPSYKGMTAGKTEVFPKFRFAICYENHQWPGYITEKIFDCMRSDCVPVYLGAPNISEYLPANTYIDRRKFSDDEELSTYLLSIDEDRYEVFRKSISEYLSGSKFLPFLCTTFAETIINVMENRNNALTS